MNALTILSPDGLPPARARLVDLNRRIADAERHLQTLQSGKSALERELSRAAEAKAELQSLVAADAESLVDRLRSGATWALSAITQTRTHSVAAQLNQSRVEASVGEAALSSVTGEIAELERQIAEMQSSKADLVRSVLLESAGGFRSDLATAIENLREAMAILCALDRITARSDGSYTKGSAG
jgi:chromosome segregation ATPase